MIKKILLLLSVSMAVSFPLYAASSASNGAGTALNSTVVVQGLRSQLDADGDFGQIDVNEGTAPGTPASGNGVIYEKTDGVLYFKNDAGSESDLTAGAGGGDSVSIDGVSVTDPDFVSTGQIDFTDSSNTVTADINDDTILEADLKAVNASADEDILTRETTTGDFEWHTPAELSIAVYSDTLAVFAATTSLQLLGVISDETGTGALVFGTAPTFTTSITVTGSATLDADGIDLDASNAYEIGGTAVIADSAGTATLSNIDAIDATTETTFEAAIDSLVNLTVVGTIATGTWEGTTIAVDQGGTGDTSYTNGQILVGNTTGNTLAKQTFGGDISSMDNAGSVTFAASNTNLTTLSNVTTVGALGSGSITTGFGNIDNGASSLAGGSLDVSDGNITNVADIALDSLTADGTTITANSGVSMAENNISNVGNIALDSLSADGSTITANSNVDMADNLLIKPVLRDYTETVLTTNSGSSITLDLTNANNFDITLNANTTLDFTGAAATGTMSSFTLLLRQDATGSRTTTLPVSARFAGGTAPTLTTTASALDILTGLTVTGGSKWHIMLGSADSK